MSQERSKEGTPPPERARAARDATIMVPGPPTFASEHPPDSRSPVPLDSYQPGKSDATDAIASERIAPSTATIGTILRQVRRPPSQRLEIEHRVAAGGMGSIDVAVDRALDRRIAIKTLHPHLRGDDGSVRMFLREARLTSLLDHPHIVPLYDLAEREDGSLFFAMKLVEGQTLAALIGALPRGVPATATLYGLLDVVAKVCDALAFAHSRGVLHCDVKPANVMVGEYGQVFLMDWGIARLVATETAPGSDRMSALEAEPPAAVGRRGLTDNSVIGTPCYMSPEQARGDRKALDPRSDVFLLGATLYELLTHRPPYVTTDRTETLALAAAGAFPSPRKVAGELAVPLELERIVLRAMAKAPEQRYPSVSALKEDLVRFMRGGAEFPRRSFSAGETIVREGDPGDAAYILVEGRCEIRRQGESGVEAVKTIGPGDVFGEMAILTEGPRTATVVALEPTTVLVMTSHELEQEMSALKPWIATLLKSLAARFRVDDTQKRNTAVTLPSPVLVGEQLLMLLTTWGEDDGRGGRWLAWSRFGPRLESQIGLAAVALFPAIERYGLVLDVEADRLTSPNLADLRARVLADLAPAL